MHLQTRILQRSRASIPVFPPAVFTNPIKTRRRIGLSCAGSIGAHSALRRKPARVEASATIRMKLAASIFRAPGRQRRICKRCRAPGGRRIWHSGGLSSAGGSWRGAGGGFSPIVSSVPVRLRGKIPLPVPISKNLTSILTSLCCLTLGHLILTSLPLSPRSGRAAATGHRCNSSGSGTAEPVAFGRSPDRLAVTSIVQGRMKSAAFVGSAPKSLYPSVCGRLENRAVCCDVHNVNYFQRAHIPNEIFSVEYQPVHRDKKRTAALFLHFRIAS